MSQFPPLEAKTKRSTCCAGRANCGRKNRIHGFSRACALSEVLWNTANSRDFEEFSVRLGIQLRLLDRMNVNYKPLDRGSRVKVHST